MIISFKSKKRKKTLNLNIKKILSKSKRLEKCLYLWNNNSIQNQNKKHLILSNLYIGGGKINKMM